jgi:glyoxylase-like metal-dependent hydrolase (beta-lactamase superfamily II)
MHVRRRVGELTVTALDDGAAVHFDAREDAIPGATAADWDAADALDPGGRTPGGGLWLHFRCFAVRRGDGPVTLVDAGVGPAGAPGAWGGVPGRLPDDLAAAGIAAGDVTTIVLTHLHSDHIGWASPLSTPFPQARIVAQRADVAAFPEADLPAGRLDVVDGDATVGPGVRVVATPGHTPGHQCVVVSAGGERLAVTGDLFVHAVQFLRPELAYAHDMDAARARRSRTEFLREGGLWVGAAHPGQPFLRTAAR